MSANSQSSPIQTAKKRWQKPIVNLLASVKRPIFALAAATIIFACNDGQGVRERNRVGVNHEEDATKPISLAQDNRFSLNTLSARKSSKHKGDTKRSDLVANGEELYTVLCSSCHGGAIALVGRTSVDLQKAIHDVPEMSNLEETLASDPDLLEALLSYINGSANP